MKSDVGVGFQTAGWVGEDVSVLAGEAEEPLQSVQLARSVARVGDGGEEGFNVAGADQGPVGDLGTVGAQVAGQVADGGEVDLEGAVGSGLGSGASGTLS